MAVVVTVYSFGASKMVSGADAEGDIQCPRERFNLTTGQGYPPVLFRRSRVLRDFLLTEFWEFHAGVQILLKTIFVLESCLLNQVCNF